MIAVVAVCATVSFWYAPDLGTRVSTALGISASEQQIFYAYGAFVGLALGIVGGVILSFEAESDSDDEEYMDEEADANDDVSSSLTNVMTALQSAISFEKSEEGDHQGLSKAIAEHSVPMQEAIADGDFRKSLSALAKLEAAVLMWGAACENADVITHTGSLRQDLRAVIALEKSAEQKSNGLDRQQNGDVSVVDMSRQPPSEQAKSA